MQLATSWMDTYCFSSMRRFRRFLMLVAVICSSVGAVAGGAAGTATAWRAFGLPSVATEAFVRDFVGKQVTPLTTSIATLESRSNDLFNLQQVVLTKVSDPKVSDALAAQIANIMLVQKRIEARLGSVNKPAPGRIAVNHY